MDRFHERLARIGLIAGDRYGFALAGGYAMQQNGFLDRPSEDVDLFTERANSIDFDEAVQAIIAAYQQDGLRVGVDKRFDTFARLIVSDDRQESKVELAVDWRANRPVNLAIGPVLHPDDAVANKMGALFGRAEPRDFIDVDAAVSSGRYRREQLLALAASADSGFDPRMFAQALGLAATLPASDFAEYGMRGRRLDDMRARFAEWREELLAT